MIDVKKGLTSEDDIVIAMNLMTTFAKILKQKDPGLSLRDRE